MANKLRAAREAAHLTQVQLSARALVPQPTISALETGRRNAGPATRARLAAALDVDEAWLFSAPAGPHEAAA